MASVNQLPSASKPPAGPNGENLWAFPLSFAQQRLWLLDQLEPGGTSYSIPWSIRLTGALHAQALENSLNEIIRRHESLRTTFTSQNGEPVQVVHESSAISLTFTDLSSGDSASRNEQAVQLAKEEAGRPIDLENGPLMRGRLIRLGDHEHVLLLTLHHIVFDGWSRRVFARELSELYEAFRAGNPSPLPELRLQYADYVVWQRKKVGSKALENQLAYWKKQLAAAPANLNLPADHSRPAFQTFRGTALPVAFSRETYDGLSALASNCGATLFMLLLAGFQALLSRYSGDTDILVGTPIANRTRSETEEMIGLFANTLVLRGDLAGDPTVLELLRRTKQTALDAYANQDVPFEKLVEELNPERSLSHNPLFQVMFSLQNAARQGFQLSGLEITPLQATIETAKFDLSIFLAESSDGLRGRIEYNTDLFERATIERLWRHYERLLSGAVANPELRLSELPMLGNDEREELLTGWNNTAAVFPDCCVHEWFEQQARQTPKAIACRFEGERLTYRELNEKANQLAHDLVERGARAGERIGVYLERSLDLLIALLAVQKTGAAYVPVDPGYPSERIKQILEQAQVKALVTQSSLETSVPENRASVVCLDREQAAIAGQSHQNLGQRAQPDDAVYVIFTSGSTGRPKGVEVPHRAVVNLLASMAQELHMSEADVFPALASFAFDMCIPELYLALVTGGTVALGKARLAADGTELAAFLQRTGATIVHATPTTWRLLLDAGFTGKGLKRAIGAEALPPELCRRLLEAEPSLYNFYGPTETTVWSTLQHFRSPDEAVSIGRPLANTRIYILDSRQQPVPVGVEGELYIGGAGVAHGYLHQPDLTAERFVNDPFVSRGRMYRTGDRARYWADGRIEYRGRADFQVKLRGYRIELGEIEAVLVQHPAVAQSVAGVREDRPGDQRLVAYVVAQAGGRIEEAELRAWVKTRLPDYMVPVRVVAVERFALTPNGKVDRKQLPAVEYQRLEGDEAYQAARTPVEEVMAGIWAEVLKLEQVGVADDFFQLGGHSLLGTQVMSRVRSALAVELPLRALFEAPTVRGLAQKVEALRQGGGQRLMPRLERRERPEKLPLSFAQQRMWFLDQLEPGNALYNVPYLVRLQGRLDGQLLERSLQEIVKRHEALRTRFVLCGDEPVQVIDAWQGVALKRVGLTEGTAEERLAEARRQVLEEIRQPFDLAAGPLWRAALYQLAPEDHVFVLSTHHIVSDRWSLGVLAEELAALYAAFGEGKPSPLPELPVQYADYALWQRACLTEELLAPQLAFWKQHLAGAPPTLNLPLDYLPTGGTTNDGAQISEILPRPLSEDLKELSRREGVTLFMTVLAAWNVLLAQYCGDSDIVVGTPIAGRRHAAAERLIGFFVNTLAIRTNISESLNFRALLRQVREAVLGAYANQDVPFDRVVEALRPDRGLGRNPIFQVMLMVQNIGRMKNTVGEANISAFAVPNQTAKFDLTLIVTETAEGLRFTFEYKTSLFEPSTIRRMQGHLHYLLEQLINNPEKTISSCSLLKAEERSLILSDWNATQREYPRTACLQDLIKPIVERNPRKTAVVFGDQQLSYAELNERSNRLANHLRAKGVRENNAVGLFVSRSINTLVALLGILKAGGTYVPIDPNYPKDRIAFVLEDAGVMLLVTERALSELLPSVGLPRVYLDQDEAEINAGSAADLAQTAKADSSAYVIFTSGSTGRPKGVEVSHRNLVNFLLSMRSEPGLVATDTVLALTSLSFDIAALELYLPLITGAKIVLLSREHAIDPKKLAEAIYRFHPTVMQATPTTWRMLIEAGWSGNARLKALCGGEALSLDLAQQLFSRCRELWNMYGPTETTVWSSTYRIEKLPKSLVPIGRPIANTSLYVLDALRQPVPIGVVGELYIGGEGVAKGYRNRPDLDAERFFPNPFAESDRIYRTGDLARFLPDGNILCLGRTDNQIKIRGHRIELGEVEACLLEHPGVQACAVIARDQGPNGIQLVVYYVVRPSYEVSPQLLRSHLRRCLPDYLLPNIYQAIDSIPVTTGGKLDRLKLPEPDFSQAQSSGATGPRDDFELVLLQIWRTVLGIESCSMTDNFFELGGHSLSLVRMGAMIEKEFSRAVPTAYLFESPTIEKIGAFLRSGHADPAGFFVPFHTKGSGPALFLVHSVIGDVVGCRHLIRFLDPNQRTYGIQVPLEFRTEDFVSSVEKVAARYVEELLAFEPQGPFLLAGWSAGAPIALEMAQQLKARGYEVPLLVSIDAAPANTGGGTSPTSPLYYWKLLCNLPYCLKYDLLLDFSWPRFMARAKRRTQSILKKWKLKRRKDRMALAQHRVAAFLAGAEYSESARRFMGSLYMTLQRYVPKRYDGKVVLYKVRGESLLRLKEVDRKWAKIADDLDVVPVRGNHVTVMLEKYVPTIADDLNLRLAKIQKTQTLKRAESVVLAGRNCL